MRAHPTEAEKRLWSMLRGSRTAGSRFRRQQIIFPYIVDFACLPARLIVETDGSQHADDRRDAGRDAWLTRRGFRVLRFWNNDVLAQTEQVAAAICAALNNPHPPTAARWAPPSPLQGEGLSGASHG
jgi:very-short-patch-repair endonuclease